MLIVAIITAVFVSSMIFAYLMLTDPTISEDGSKTAVYAAVFVAVLIVLNVSLLLVALAASKKMKALAASKECASCGAAIRKADPECPVCHAVQVTGSTYLDPKKEEATVRPKKKM